MKRTISLAALTLTSALALTACGDATESDTADATTTAETTTDEHQTTTEATEDGGNHADMHPADGGPPPAGIEEAENPTYPVGTEVTLTADHMPGMDGAPAPLPRPLACPACP